MKGLTDRQAEVLDFISKKRATLRQIGIRFGFSHAGAYYHMKALEKKGYVKLGERYSHRSYKIIKGVDA
mgnify:CR=1 FL=1|jgi:repressor LexA